MVRITECNNLAGDMFKLAFDKTSRIPVVVRGGLYYFPQRRPAVRREARIVEIFRDFTGFMVARINPDIPPVLMHHFALVPGSCVVVRDFAKGTKKAVRQEIYAHPSDVERICGSAPEMSLTPTESTVLAAITSLRDRKSRDERVSLIADKAEAKSAKASLAAKGLLRRGRATVQGRDYVAAHHMALTVAEPQD